MSLKSILAAGAALTMLTGAAYAGHHEKKDAAMEKADIVDTAVAAGSFNTLVAAVQAAGLEATLRGEGPFTVFAPTDEAFAALPEGTVENLLKPENKDQLAGILTYHVVAGKVKSKDLAGKTLDVETVNGATVAVDATDGVKVGDADVV
ncbi:MAG: fasciclin domain-containing protein, partial [Pseudomonadota bacterium]